MSRQSPLGAGDAQEPASELVGPLVTPLGLQGHSLKRSFDRFLTVTVEAPPGRLQGLPVPPLGAEPTLSSAGSGRRVGLIPGDPPPDAETAPMGVLGITTICIAPSKQVGGWARASRAVTV